ncbi:hypothetical protein [Microvirga puerhi]|uniref:Uncharacterized protein n=1 Tax=Microvirga puerhi TaxID=2876078 RepID=A0ABS7VL99_9HYPH|nr:hypothetical protein [Microvirga puerhi]MBZ6076274.1 hypothetical protein [Microvirga puerhi]
MNRSVALRTFVMFTIVTSLAAIIGWTSQVEIAEIVFLIGASLSALMLFFVWATPAPIPVPVRVRHRRR